MHFRLSNTHPFNLRRLSFLKIFIVHHIVVFLDHWVQTFESRMQLKPRYVDMRNVATVSNLHLGQWYMYLRFHLGLETYYLSYVFLTQESETNKT